MSLSATLASYFGKKIADEIYQRLRTDILGMFTDEKRATGPTLARIEQLLEHQYLNDLRDGIDSMKVGELESAREHFMAARPQGFTAPVPELLFGCCLVRLSRLRPMDSDSLNRLQFGETLIDKAVKSNPELVYPLKFSGLEQSASTATGTFAVGLPNSSFIELFAEKSIGKRFVESYSELTKWAAMEKLVSTAGALVCEVRLGSTLAKPGMRVLGRLDIVKRTWTWARRIGDWRLAWATNDHVLCVDPEHRAKLFAACDGREIGEANEPYYSALICPNIPSTLTEFEDGAAVFARTSRKPSGIRKAYRNHDLNETAGRFRRSWDPPVYPPLVTLLNHTYSVSIDDSREVPIFYEGGKRMLRVVNRWLHRHGPDPVEIKCQLRSSVEFDPDLSKLPNDGSLEEGTKMIARDLNRWLRRS